MAVNHGEKWAAFQLVLPPTNLTAEEDLSNITTIMQAISKTVGYSELAEAGPAVSPYIVLLFE
jgi:hypothetical protein